MDTDSETAFWDRSDADPAADIRAAMKRLAAQQPLAGVVRLEANDEGMVSIRRYQDRMDDLARSLPRSVGVSVFPLCVPLEHVKGLPVPVRAWFSDGSSKDLD